MKDKNVQVKTKRRGTLHVKEKKKKRREFLVQSAVGSFRSPFLSTDLQLESFSAPSDSEWWKSARDFKKNRTTTLIWSLFPSVAGSTGKQTAGQCSKQKGRNESQTYSRRCFGRSKIQKPEYTAHTVATFIVQTAKYGWCVKMHRLYLHRADCPITKKLNIYLNSNLHISCICVLLTRRKFFINAASCSRAAGDIQTLQVNVLCNWSVSHPRETKLWK